MKSSKWIMAIMLFAQANIVLSQDFNGTGTANPRIVTLTYAPERITRLLIADGYHVMISFAPGERIETIAIGDANGWQATASKRGDLLFVKWSGEALPTNMTIVTDLRVYLFELEPTDMIGGAPYQWRFTYTGDQGLGDPENADISSASYLITGDTEIRPKRVFSQDGRTFIEWDQKAAIPATYALVGGQETLTNGDMIGGLYVIMDAPDQLVFRMDKMRANAKRGPVKAAGD
jgi:type IV secretion system protein VirB9